MPVFTRTMELRHSQDMSLDETRNGNFMNVGCTVSRDSVGSVIERDASVVIASVRETPLVDIQHK
jgi:hypothetical protein